MFMNRRDRESLRRDVRTESHRGQAGGSRSMIRRRSATCLIPCTPHGLRQSNPRRHRPANDTDNLKRDQSRRKASDNQWIPQPPMPIVDNRVESRGGATQGRSVPRCSEPSFLSNDTHPTGRLYRDSHPLFNLPSPRILLPPRLVPRPPHRQGPKTPAQRRLQLADEPIRAQWSARSQAGG